MKTFALVASGLLGCISVALASPAVGDTATYVGKIQVAGQTLVFENTQTLTAYDSVENRYKRVTITRAPGAEPSVQEEWVGADWIISDGSIDTILNRCDEMGGVPEKIEVKAGIFETCRIDQQGNVLNLGRVPFALIRGEGDTMKMELASFQRGI